MLAEALAQVKHELGRDAVILRTRAFRKGRLWGLLGGKSMWEVTASQHGQGLRGEQGLYIPQGAGRGTFADEPTFGNEPAVALRHE